MKKIKRRTGGLMVTTALGFYLGFDLAGVDMFSWNVLYVFGAWFITFSGAWMIGHRTAINRMSVEPPENP